MSKNFLDVRLRHLDKKERERKRKNCQTFPCEMMTGPWEEHTHTHTQVKKKEGFNRERERDFYRMKKPLERREKKRSPITIEINCEEAMCMWKWIRTCFPRYIIDPFVCVLFLSSGINPSPTPSPLRNAISSSASLCASLYKQDHFPRTQTNPGISLELWYSWSVCLNNPFVLTTTTQKIRPKNAKRRGGTLPHKFIHYMGERISGSPHRPPFSSCSNHIL